MKFFAIAALLAASTVPAMAFGPTDLTGQQPDASTYKALIKAAEAVSPPRNGKEYVFGFANLESDISFCVKVAQGLKSNAEVAGIKLDVADNRLSGATALQNAQSFALRHVDYVIDFQTDANFGPVIVNTLKAGKIPVTAIDIPMPGADFFGANNPRSGFLGGVYLAKSAILKWGQDKANTGYLVVGALPQSGAIPAMRTSGQIAGFLAILPSFHRDHIIRIDTKNTLQTSFTQMSNVLERMPAGVPLMGVAINDQAATGMLRAAHQAGRGGQAIFVGMGADEIKTLVDEPDFLASVGYFPERYGSYLIPLALMRLAGQNVPPAVLMKHVMINKGDVCKFYPDYKCVATPEPSGAFPQQAFEAYLLSLRQDPVMKGLEHLIPSE